MSDLDSTKSNEIENGFDNGQNMGYEMESLNMIKTVDHLTKSKDIRENVILRLIGENKNLLVANDREDEVIRELLTKLKSEGITLLDDTFTDFIGMNAEDYEKLAQKVSRENAEKEFRSMQEKSGEKSGPDDLISKEKVI
jgi:hypothetical protein